MKDLDYIHKLGLFMVPISLLFGLIISLIFGFALPHNTNIVWLKSFLLGLFLGLMNFGFMVKGTKKLENDILNSEKSPIKRNMLYLFFRIIVFGAVFSVIIVDQITNNPPNFHIAPAIIGYLLHWVVLLVVHLVFKIKDKQKKEVID